MGMNRCPQCDYPIRTESSWEKTMRKVLRSLEVEDHPGDYCYSGFEAWEEVRLNEPRHLDRYVVRKVDQDLKHEFDYAENHVYMVFEVSLDPSFEGDGEFFKIEGSKDSYGGSDWDEGNFRSVNKQVDKVVWLWTE